MKHRIVTDSHAHEFRILRNRIEGEVQAPAVILVTSASERDGAHLTAFGLAESLSKTHQRTALVLTSADVVEARAAEAQAGAPVMRRRASDRLEAGNVAGAGGVSTIKISRERLATISRTNVAGMVDDLRSKHDYVVIDGGDLSNNSVGMMLLTSADATLVTFLVGREELPADRTMLDMLERNESKVLGVVMNDQGAIDRFMEHENDAEAEPVTEKKLSNPIVAHGKVALQKIGISF